MICAFCFHETIYAFFRFGVKRKEKRDTHDSMIENARKWSIHILKENAIVPVNLHEAQASLSKHRLEIEADEVSNRGFVPPLVTIINPFLAGSIPNVHNFVWNPAVSNFTFYSTPCARATHIKPTLRLIKIIPRRFCVISVRTAFSQINCSEFRLLRTRP